MYFYWFMALIDERPWRESSDWWSYRQQDNSRVSPIAVYFSVNQATDASCVAPAECSGEEALINAGPVWLQLLDKRPFHAASNSFLPQHLALTGPGRKLQTYKRNDSFKACFLPFPFADFYLVHIWPIYSFLNPFRGTYINSCTLAASGII